MFRAMVFNTVVCRKHVIEIARCLFVRTLTSHSIYTPKGDPLQLAYDHYVPPNKGTEASSSPVIISHGLFANRKIWGPISKAVSEKSNRDVYAVDLRNHGDSPYCEEFFLPDITIDLQKFVSTMPSAPTLVGHSLGGLCSILLSITKPQLIKDVILVDISPVSFPEGMELHVIYFTKKMHEILPKIPHRLNLSDAKNFVDAFFQSSIPIPFVRRLLLSNLSRTDEGFMWKLNLDAIERIFGNPKIFNLFPFKGRYDGDATLIYAEQSPYVKLEEEAEMKNIFPKLKLLGIPNCTHWIYEEKPDKLIEILAAHLQ